MTQSTTGLVEFKPCPFCGDDKPKLLCGGAGNYFIQCGRCNATSDDRTREHAITAWNTRPTDPTIAELVAALKGIRDGDVPRPVDKYWNSDKSPSKHDRCIHGFWMYDTCGNCIDAFVETALTKSRSAL